MQHHAPMHPEGPFIQADQQQPLVGLPDPHVLPCLWIWPLECQQGTAVLGQPLHAACRADDGRSRDQGGRLAQSEAIALRGSRGGSPDPTIILVVAQARSR